MIKRGSSIIFYQSLNRPILIFGVDRSIFFLSMGLCLPIAFSARFHWLMDLIAMICFSITIYLGRIINQADPQMIQIYKRHIRYSKYYNSQPSIHASIENIYPSVPFYNGQKGII